MPAPSATKDQPSKYFRFPINVRWYNCIASAPIIIINIITTAIQMPIVDAVQIPMIWRCERSSPFSFREDSPASQIKWAIPDKQGICNLHSLCFSENGTSTNAEPARGSCCSKTLGKARKEQLYRSESSLGRQGLGSLKIHWARWNSRHRFAGVA